MNRHNTVYRHVGLDILEQDQVVHTDGIFMRRAPVAHQEHTYDAPLFRQASQMLIDHIPGESSYQQPIPAPEISEVPGAVRTAVSIAGVSVFSVTGMGIGVTNFEQQPVYSSIMIAASSVVAAAGLGSAHFSRKGH